MRSIGVERGLRRLRRNILLLRRDQRCIRQNHIPALKDISVLPNRKAGMPALLRWIVAPIRTTSRQREATRSGLTTVPRGGTHTNGPMAKGCHALIGLRNIFLQTIGCFPLKCPQRDMSGCETVTTRYW